MENEKLGQQPAFPTEVGYQDGKMMDSFQTGNTEAHFNGMSKRFYAACAAMQGILANQTEGCHYEFEKNLIARAYELADELLKQENQ